MAFDEDTEYLGQQAIDTSGDDSGAAPAVPSQPDDSGAAPVADSQTQPQEQAQAGPPQRFGPLGRIVSYLMGEGADHPQVLAQAGQQVDPSGQMSPSDRNLLAVEQANQQGGPEAAWKLVQANRVAYNAKQAFAYAALNGNQQKPPDVHAAVDAANQAADHVLDGSNVRFMVSTGGQITATVKSPGSQQPQVFDLSPDQFRQYLNVGGAGQFDKQLQPGGIGRSLTNVTQNQQRVSSVANMPPLKGARQQAQAAPSQDQGEEPETPTASPQGETRLGGKVNGFGPSIDPDLGYSAQLQRRANAMFPPGAASNHDRQEWMAAQQSAEDVLTNKRDVADSNSEARLEAAKVRAQGGVDQQTVKNAGGLAVQAEKTKGWQYASDQKLKAAQAQIAQKLAHEENTNANSAQTRALKLVQTKLMSAQPLSKDEQAMVDTLPGAAQASAQVTKPQASQQAPQRQAAPASGTQQQTVPPPAQRVVNQVYNTPKGPHRWMGNGWQPVQ